VIDSRNGFDLTVSFRARLGKVFIPCLQPYVSSCFIFDDAHVTHVEWKLFNAVLLRQLGKQMCSCRIVLNALRFCARDWHLLRGINFEFRWWAASIQGCSDIASPKLFSGKIVWL